MRLALVALVACGGAPALPKAPSFDVIDVGAEPRTVVRFETEAGATDRFAITYKQRTTTKYENTVMEEGTAIVDLPSVRAVGTSTATAVSPAGDAEISIVIEDATVLDDAIDRRTSLVAEQLASAMRGVRVRMSRTSWGELSILDGREVAVVDEMVRSSIRFPREPIGIGARWSQSSTIVADKVRWVQTATYTLRDRTDHEVTIDVATESRADEQALHAEPNATTRLTGGTGRGSGHVVIPLRGIGMRGKAEDARTLNILITRGRTRVEAAITGEQFLSFDVP